MSDTKYVLIYKGRYGTTADLFNDEQTPMYAAMHIILQNLPLPSGYVFTSKVILDNIKNGQWDEAKATYEVHTSETFEIYEVTYVEDTSSPNFTEEEVMAKAKELLNEKTDTG